MNDFIIVTSKGYFDKNMPTLKEIIYKYLSKNLNLDCYKMLAYNKKRQEENRLILPSSVCDGLLCYQHTKNYDVSDLFLAMFYTPADMPLKHVKLRNSSITNQGLDLLFRHHLISLSLWYCHNIRIYVKDCLEIFSNTLKSLEIGLDVDILRSPEPFHIVNFRINCPKLNKLIILGVDLHSGIRFDHLQQLSYLDLTQCSIFRSFDFTSLYALRSLRTLILHDIWPLHNHLKDISLIVTLEHLDISSSVTVTGLRPISYESPNETLEMLIISLPLLMRLDISGTNLAGDGGPPTRQYGEFKEVSGIAGLTRRLSKPLKFLGLYTTAYEASRRPNIPALEIAGDANETQLLSAARRYHDRPAVLSNVLHDLCELYQVESCKSIKDVLEISLNALDNHLNYISIRRLGSSLLYYIIRQQNKHRLGPILKIHIIETLLNAMQIHMFDDFLLKNCYLVLCQFNIPQDILFEYERFVSILLQSVTTEFNDGYIQRIAVYLLLNSSSHVINYKPELISGYLGTNIVTKMLELVKKRLNKNVSDDIIEIAWVVMHIITENIPNKLKCFLKNGGLKLFMICLRTFPDHRELISVMLKLIKNVAEIIIFRPHLITTELINIFENLLNLEKNGFEISYMSAQILAYLVSDGREAWTISEPERSDILMHMDKTIKLWNLRSERNTSYQNFITTLKLLEVFHTPECQHFAVWSLINLLQLSPRKLYYFFKNFNGQEMIMNALDDPRPYSYIKELIGLFLKKYQEQCVIIEKMMKFRSPEIV